MSLGNGRLSVQRWNHEKQSSQPPTTTLPLVRRKTSFHQNICKDFVRKVRHVLCCRSLFNLGDEDEDETQEEDKAKDNGTISPAIYGSRAITFGGGNELIADQFNLYTVQQKHNQIVLIQVFCYILLRCLC